MDYNAVEHAESMDSSLSKASSSSVEPAESLDILLVILFAVFVCLSTFVILSIGGYSWGDLRVLCSYPSSSISPPMMPVQPISQVYNPFSLTLVNNSRASLTNGVTVLLTSHTPCWLGVYAGVEIANVYPVIHASWSSLADQINVRNNLQQISQFQQDIDLLEEVENKEIQLQFPDIHLGAPPRSCYPLVLFLLDTTLLDASPTLLNEAHQIGFMVTLFHLKDDVCSADSHIIHQFVRTPLGRPYDLKQLYVTGADVSQPATDESHRTTSPSSESHDIDPNISAPSGEYETSCIVCQSSPVQRALLPCRHACVCNDCCRRLLHCPLCRAFIIRSFDLETDS